jgi:TonB family protein
MMYMVQVILYTGMMLLIYLLFLRNRPFHQLSRYYLLASAILPTFIPHLHMPKAWQESVQNGALFQIELPEALVNAAKAKHTYTSIVQTGVIFYCSIAALILIWHAWQLYKLRAIIKNGKKQTRDAYTLITDTGHGPGSFRRYIIFPGEEVNRCILAHEIAHVRLKHTEDIVALNLLQTALWPNLFLIWIKKEIKQVHEFQADAQVPAAKDDYAALLLSSVFNTQTLPTMHLFIIHPIKRRIMMLQKKGEGNLMNTSLKIAAAISLLLSTAVIAQNSYKKTGKEKSATTNTVDSVPYTYVERMPEPTYKLSQFISENIKYPSYAKINKIEGRVVVKFVVNDKGEITNPAIVRSPDTSLSNAALDIVNKLPKWTPGEQKGKKVSVYYTLPIVFKLS